MSDELTSIELFIYKVLKQLPDSMHVTEDGLTLYLLNGAEDGLLKIQCTGGKPFGTMNAEELNQVVTDFLEALTE